MSEDWCPTPLAIAPILVDSPIIELAATPIALLVLYYSLSLIVFVFITYSDYKRCFSYESIYLACLAQSKSKLHSILIKVVFWFKY